MAKRKQKREERLSPQFIGPPESRHRVSYLPKGAVFRVKVYDKEGNLIEEYEKRG